ncbi:hypothetical protein KHP62_09335 [Rhodobacteraceae bacterium NNCM2]|nr:hypothetical protein [Coraliihabitans acroporae]
MTLLLMTLWLVAINLVFRYFGDTRNPSAEAVVPMVGLAVITWPCAKFLVEKLDYLWPATMLGLLGPICFGFAVSFSTPELRALPPDRAMAVVAGVASIGMVAFLFRFTLAGLVSPATTFAIVSVFLNIRGMSEEALYRVEGFSPRGLLAGLIDEPLAAAGAGFVALGAVVLARWLEKNGNAFGVESARPLHLIGGGIVALVAGRFAHALPEPWDLLALLGLYLLAIVWALRIERIAVMMTCHVALVAPIVLSLYDFRPPPHQIAALAAVIVGLGLVLWGRGRKFSVALGWTQQPRHIRRNWPDRVIWPYNPEIHK